MAELSQKDKFELAFRELVKDEDEFNKHWDNVVYVLNDTRMPTIKGRKFLSAKAKSKLLDLSNKFIQKRL